MPEATPDTPHGGAPAPAPAPAPVSFADALRFWLRLGFISFGGPAGQIAVMHTELVERRRWISERRFLHALNYCMLLPGPEAQQLATYLGWLMHRNAGGIVAGGLFVLPSLLLLIALSAVYVTWGQVPALSGIFHGIKPAVVAIVAHAAWRIGKRTLKNPLLAGIAAAALAAILLGAPFPLIVGSAAVAGWAGGRWVPGYFKAGGGGHGGSSGAGAAPAARALIDDDTPTPAHARFSPARLAAVVGVGLLGWALPMAALLAPDGPAGPLPQMAWFFTQAALLTFGGAYAVLPFVVQGAVAQHGWLSATQMMDGLALGETTPGPLIMVVTFVGFLGGWHTQVLGAAHPYAGAALAAVVVTWYTFLPSFVFILAGGPLVEATHGNLRVTAPLTAVSAAVVGVIAHLAGVFGLQVGWPQGLAAAPDLPALAVAAGAALALFRSGRGVMETIGVCALLGLGGRLLLGI